MPLKDSDKNFHFPNVFNYPRSPQEQVTLIQIRGGALLRVAKLLQIQIHAIIVTSNDTTTHDE